MMIELPQPTEPALVFELVAQLAVIKVTPAVCSNISGNMNFLACRRTAISIAIEVLCCCFSAAHDSGVDRSKEGE